MDKQVGPREYIEKVLREEHLCEEAPRVAKLIVDRLAAVMSAPAGPLLPAIGIKVDRGVLVFTWFRPIGTSSAFPGGIRGD